jgi:hypothetical protein
MGVSVEIFGLSPQLGFKPAPHISEAFYLVLFFVRSVWFVLSASIKKFFSLSLFSTFSLVFSLFKIKSYKEKVSWFLTQSYYLIH